MPLSQTEFETLISDATKVVAGNIVWTEDEDHSPSVEFRAEVASHAGYPLFVRGTFNRELKALSYTLVHLGAGRIYGLDLGKDHHNPSCTNVGEKHKHRWKEPVRDKEAYVPLDVTEPATRPVAVWAQFCTEARITHEGLMHEPPSLQGELF